MKSLALFFFIMSILFITIGYMEKRIKEKEVEKVIEYRFIPRSILEDQLYQGDIKSNFVDMFNKEDTYLYSNLV